MKVCEKLSGKLAAGEPLGPEESKHLRGCRACSDLWASAERVRRVAKRMGPLAEPDAPAVRALVEQVGRKLARPAPSTRRSWAMAGLAVAAAALALVLLWPTMDAATEQQTAEDLFALMDEVAAVINPGLITNELEGDLGETAAGMDEGSWELPLPAGYAPVAELIEDRWL